MKSSASTTSTRVSDSPADRIKTAARQLGFDLVGIAPADRPEHADVYQDWVKAGRHGEMGYMQRRAAERIDLQKVLPGARSVVVVAMNYLGAGTGSPLPSDGRGRLAVVCGTGEGNAVSSAGRTTTHPHPDPLPQTARERGSDSPRIARYAQGSRDYHDILTEKLSQLETFIRDVGGPATHTKSYVDTGPILERDLAMRAGVGFIGKHTNLISRQLGNWIVIGEILTNLDLPADQPEKPHCGKCRRCIDACPTRAIVGPYQLDARLCISYLTIELKGSIPVELRPLIGDRVFGCDDCLEVCPWNRFAKASPAKEFQRRELPALTEFLSWDETRFKEFFHSTPIYRLKRRGFLRNVCVALGNIGDPAALPALERARGDPEPLVREHAAWAIGQIQRA